MAPAKSKATTPPPGAPPLPPTAAPPPPAVEFEAPPLVTYESAVMEVHPVGTAQYIAELEAENLEATQHRDGIKKRATEGFAAIVQAASTHAHVLAGYGGPMAGHLPQDINAIPGIDAINAAAAPVVEPAAQ